MREIYYIGMYWGVRKESVEQCAERTAEFLVCLTRADPSLAHWFKPAASRKAALAHEMRFDPADIRKLLLGSRSRREVEQDVIEELGFRFSLWNGGSNNEDSIGLNIACGGHSPFAPNSCVLELPSEGELLEHILTLPVLRSILNCMIQYWTPDWGIVNSHAYRTIASYQPKTGPQVGWITYLAERSGSLPPLPAWAQVISVDGLGSLIISTEERFTASNPMHVARANHLADLLYKAGILRPLT